MKTHVGWRMLTWANLVDLSCSEYVGRNVVDIALAPAFDELAMVLFYLKCCFEEDDRVQKTFRIVAFLDLASFFFGKGS